MLQCSDAVGWVAGRHLACKKLSVWVLAWLSVWCRLAYGSADTTATHCLQEIQTGFGFTFLVPAHPGSPGQNPESCKMVVVLLVHNTYS